MSRAIKRVPLDFDWPLNAVWTGYVNPVAPDPCPDCCTPAYIGYRSDGYTPEGRKLNEEYWGRNGWQHHLTQDEVDTLVEEGRLMPLTHTWSRETGWTPNGYRPTAEEVNAWSYEGLGHDSINHSILMKVRATRLGIEYLCSRCEGYGTVWPSPEVKKIHDEWVNFEPPEGPGWQLWETVSEGSPLSPVFETSEALVGWMERERGTSRAAAERLVANGGTIASSWKVDGEWYHGDEAALVENPEGDQASE